MPAPVTTDSVWRQVERRFFAVLAMVTPEGEARSAGVVYAVRGRRLYVGTGRSSFKTRWVAANPRVSLTVTVPRGIALLPWIAIPDATITLQGEVRILEVDQLDEGIRERLFGRLDLEYTTSELQALEIVPSGRFMTYGIDVSRRRLRAPELAKGSAPV